MEFELDSRKSETNKKKHGIDLPYFHALYGEHEVLFDITPQVYLRDIYLQEHVSGCRMGNTTPR